MARLPTSVAISIGCHAAAVAIVAAWGTGAGAVVRPTAPPPVTIELVEPAAPAPAPPMAVVLLDDVPAPAAAATDAATAPPPRPGRAEIATRAAAPRGPGEPPPAPAPCAPPRPSLLAMRGGGPPRPGAVDLRLPAGFRDALDHPPAGTAPAPGDPEPTGLLEPHGHGRYHADRGAFSVTTERDGSVHIKDARNLRVHVALPSPRTIGRGIAEWYTSDKGPDGKRGTRALADKVGGSIDRGDRSDAVIVPVLGGGFDLTDALMRRHKQDPYAAAKLAYLDATRDERVAIGRAHRADQLARAAELVRRNLAAMWARTPDLAGRKRALFELWDDCAETGDPALVEAGRAARAHVVGFIRSHLPAGSASAYTADELAALDRARRSRAHFTPYR